MWAAAFSPARLGVIECRARRATHIASNAQNLTLTAQTLANTDGKIEHAGSGTFAINLANTGTFSGQRGKIIGGHVIA